MIDQALIYAQLSRLELQPDNQSQNYYSLFSNLQIAEDYPYLI